MTAPLLRPLALSILAALASGGAAAHPADGLAGFAGGAAHPFLGLDHLLAMLAVGLLAGSRGGRACALLPAVFVAALVAGALLGRGDPPWAGVEWMIAGSVVALGLAVAAPRAVPLWAAAAGTAGFALFHGYAHGVEAPAGGFAAWLGGMALGSALLHAVGIGAVRLASLRPALRYAGPGIAAAGLVLMLGA